MFDRLKHLYSIGRTIDIDSPIKLTEAQLSLAVTKEWIDEAQKQSIINTRGDFPSFYFI